MRLSLKFKFIILALFSGSIVLAGLFYTFNATKELLDKKEEQNAENILATIKEEIASEVNDYKSEIVILSRLSSIQNLIKAKGELEDSGGNGNNGYDETLKQIEDIFYTYVSENDDYFQLRYIDKNGREVVRVDRPQEKASVRILHGDELTNKKDRYYFQESINLANGEIYVSEFDLNIENGEIQIPYIPTIRFATPVFGTDGENEGVIVLNIFGDNILDIVKLSPYPNTYLIDQDGYYLYNSQDVTKEWGRYLGNDYIFPDFAYDKSHMQGVFRNKSFLAAVEDPIHQNMHKHFFYKVNYSTVNPESFWLIAVMVDNRLFFQDYYNLQATLMAENGLVMFAVILIFIIFIIRFTKPLKYLDNAVKSLNKGDYNITIPVISKDEFGDFSYALNALIKNMRKRDKEKYEFIASASHQLRTPASVVRMNLDLVEEKLKKDPNAKEYIDFWEEISNGNKKVITILGELLKYIEIGEDYFATNLKRINTKRLANEIVDSFSDKIKAKKIKVTMDIPDRLYIKVEENRFKDVLLKLISNAVEYSNEKGKVLIKAVKEEKNKILFEIKDNGIGIPSEERIKVFEQFFRAKNAYSKKDVGSGLGLVIAKKIIEGHGGEIWFESEENKGTTFYFTIFNS